MTTAYQALQRSRHVLTSIRISGRIELYNKDGYLIDLGTERYGCYNPNKDRILVNILITVF